MSIDWAVHNKLCGEAMCSCFSVFRPFGSEPLGYTLMLKALQMYYMNAIGANISHYTW